jgi:hypothetical protein
LEFYKCRPKEEAMTSAILEGRRRSDGGGYDDGDNASVLSRSDPHSPCQGSLHLEAVQAVEVKGALVELTMQAGIVGSGERVVVVRSIDSGERVVVARCTAMLLY